MGFVVTTQGRSEAALLRAGLAAASEEDVLLPTGGTPSVRELVRQIRQVARFDSRVLVLGETGTGKEIVARAIHGLSPRRDRLFVPINCGAIPAELLESELFGHVKGAFSGAIAARQGRFELAEGGTLFLDEIGEMSLPMQVKLLRVLQERVYERVGSSQPVPCDVRVIAATHRNLRQRVAEGSFREDLYHRLNVVELRTPSLRERIDDLPELVENFVAQNLAAGRDEVRFGPQALAALRRYEWPGNIRELENLVERLAVMNGGRVVAVGDLPEAIAAAAPQVDEGVPRGEPVAGCDVADPLPPAGHAAPAPDLLPACTAAAAPVLECVESFPSGGIDLAERLRLIERRYLEMALAQSGHVLARAALLLGLKRTTLMDKLRRHGLGSPAEAREA